MKRLFSVFMVLLVLSVFGFGTNVLASDESFNDVTPDHWAANHINYLRVEGVTAGCTAAPPLYCPEDPLTRAQMAVFIGELLKRIEDNDAEQDANFVTLEEFNTTIRQSALTFNAWYRSTENNQILLLARVQTLETNYDALLRVTVAFELALQSALQEIRTLKEGCCRTQCNWWDHCYDPCND